MSTFTTVESLVTALNSEIELRKTLSSELIKKNDRIRELEKENRMLLEKIESSEEKDKPLILQSEAPQFQSTATKFLAALIKDVPPRKMLSASDHSSVSIIPYELYELKENCTKIIESEDIIYFYLQVKDLTTHDIDMVEIVYWNTKHSILETAFRQSAISSRLHTSSITIDHLKQQVNFYLKQGTSFLVLKGSNKTRKYLEERLSD